MRRVALSLAVASLLVSLPARADGTDDLEALLAESVVSTASKSAQSQSAAPATSVTISAEDLRRYGIHSLDEAINYLALGLVTQNPLHSVDVGARGVLLTSDFGNHVLLLVDGHAMNEPWDYTAYFERGAAIPFELIDHIEATLGPGSVLYGSSAMLGVINIITKRAKDYSGAHLIFETEIPTSLRVAAGYGRELRLFGVPAEATIQLEYYTQSGPSFTFAPESYGLDGVTGKPKRFTGDGPGTGIWGGTASRSYYTHVPAGYMRVIVGDFELGVHAATYKRATPYTNQFNQFVGDFDEPDNYELDRWVSLDLKYHKSLSSIVDLSARVYGDTYDFQQHLTTHAAGDCLEGQLGGCRRVIYGISRWIGLEPQVAFDWLRDGRLVTHLGADGRVRYVASLGNAIDLDTLQNPGSYLHYDQTDKAAGVYIEQFARPLAWLSVNVGARLDIDERFGSKVSPRAAVAVTPWKGGTVKAIYSEAFRGPSAYELLYSDPAAQIPATALKPESVRSLEASFEQRVGAHRLFFGVFRTWWRDMVLLEGLSDEGLAAAIAAGQLTPGTSSALQYRNLATIDNYGYNIAFEGSVLDQRLRYGLNLTGAYARRAGASGVALPLTVAPELFGNARVSYDLGGPWPSAALAAQFSGSRPADRAFDGGFTPTPYASPQLELRATLAGAVPLVKGLRYRASADYTATTHSPYVVGPVQAGTAEQPNAQLAPLDRFRTSIGLQYDLPL